jgi:pteridine reductase
VTRINNEHTKMDIKNKIVLITGGAVRIGRAISLKMAEMGAQVFCHYHKSKDAANALKEECEKKGLSVHLLQADLTKIKSAELLIQKVIDQAGSIDILINNAAIFFSTPLGTITETQWDQLFNLNLKAVFFCSQKAGQFMYKKGNGKIINIGDASGEKIWPGYIPYSLTKNGLIAMTKGMAKALAPNVLVNCINLGPILFPENYNEEQKEKALSTTLLKRQGKPADVVEAVRFLLIDTDYITGATINLDGGKSII